MKKLRILKLYEEFVDSKNSIIRQFLNKKMQEIKYWFSEGSLSTNTQLLDLETSDEEIGMLRHLKLDFSDDLFRYQVIILIDHSMFNENNLEKCDLTIKKYEIDGSEILAIKEENDLGIENLTEDYILDVISNIDTEEPKENTEISTEEENTEEIPTQTENTETQTPEETPEEKTEF